MEVWKNTFIVTFATETNKQRVVNGKPWLFDGHLFAQQDLDGSCHLEETKITIESFWIRLYNLPFQCMNLYYGNLIGQTICTVLDIDVNGDDTGWREFLRIRVKLNLFKPLVRGRALE